MTEEIIRTQVSITKGELEVIEIMEPLDDSSIEGAITNGIIKQLISNKYQEVEVIDD